MAITGTCNIVSTSSLIATTCNSYALTCSSTGCSCGTCSIARGQLGSTMAAAGVFTSVTIVKRGSTYVNPVALNLYQTFTLASGLRSLPRRWKRRCCRHSDTWLGHISIILRCWFGVPTVSGSLLGTATSISFSAVSITPAAGTYTIPGLAPSFSFTTNSDIGTGYLVDATHFSVSISGLASSCLLTANASGGTTPGTLKITIAGNSFSRTGVVALPRPTPFLMGGAEEWHNPTSSVHQRH